MPPEPGAPPGPEGGLDPERRLSPTPLEGNGKAGGPRGDPRAGGALTCHRRPPSLSGGARLRPMATLRSLQSGRFLAEVAAAGGGGGGNAFPAPGPTARATRLDSTRLASPRRDAAPRPLPSPGPARRPLPPSLPPAHPPAGSTASSRRRQEVTRNERGGRGGNQKHQERLRRKREARRPLESTQSACAQGTTPAQSVSLAHNIPDSSLVRRRQA